MSKFVIHFPILLLSFFVVFKTYSQDSLALNNHEQFEAFWSDSDLSIDGRTTYAYPFTVEDFKGSPVFNKYMGLSALAYHHSKHLINFDVVRPLRDFNQVLPGSVYEQKLIDKFLYFNNSDKFKYFPEEVLLLKESRSYNFTTLKSFASEIKALVIYPSFLNSYFKSGKSKINMNHEELKFILENFTHLEYLEIIEEEKPNESDNIELLSTISQTPIFKQLKYLHVPTANVELLNTISQLKHLKGLIVNYTNIKDNEVLANPFLPNAPLEFLHLDYHGKLTGKEFSKMKTLKVLRLHSCSFSETSIFKDMFSPLKELIALELIACVGELSLSNPHLQELDISFTLWDETTLNLSNMNQLNFIKIIFEEDLNLTISDTESLKSLAVLSQFDMGEKITVQLNDEAEKLEDVYLSCKTVKFHSNYKVPNEAQMEIRYQDAVEITGKIDKKDKNITIYKVED